MTNSEYLYCVSRWNELYREKMELHKKLKAVYDEMDKLNVVFNNLNSILEIKFPYKEISS